MVRLAEFKGLNLITLTLSYNSTAIELISEYASKLCQMSLGMVMYHFLPNPCRKTLSPSYDLAELPIHF